ncbi:MAG: bifunctional 5,10-methylenetetrahydrofolate dehydrogenase/5,10-methenyltetrahydrofolate cyclohydrolase [Acidobacteriota bacterium]
MSARLLDGKAIAATIEAEVAQGVRQLQERAGVVPRLSVILVGDNPASQVYVRSKARAAGKAGIRSEIIRMPESASTAEVLARLEALNDDPDVDGILVQLPLPRGVAEEQIMGRVHSDKDVDALTPASMGRLVLGTQRWAPCTPAGVMEILQRSGIPIKGKRVTIVGRSNLVGKPLALLMLRAHATLTLCHTRTVDLESETRRAEILVAAAGRMALIGRRHIAPGATVIDVGINRVSDRGEAERLFAGDPKRLEEVERKGSTLVGDVHPAEARECAGALTPVPGGVGPLTVAMLLRNTLEAARLRRGAVRR